MKHQLKFYPQAYILLVSLIIFGLEFWFVCVCVPLSLYLRKLFEFENINVERICVVDDDFINDGIKNQFVWLTF